MSQRVRSGDAAQLFRRWSKRVSYEIESDRGVIEALLVIWGLVLTGAVIVLYAMLAELWTRGSSPSTRIDGIGDPVVIEDFQPRQVRILPDGSALPPETRGVLIVSTACESCRGLMSDWKFYPRDAVDQLSLVVVAPTAAAAVELTGPAGLSTDDYLVDVGGEWSLDTLGINSSPTQVALDAGQAVSAYHVLEMMHVTMLLSGHPEQRADSGPPN